MQSATAKLWVPGQCEQDSAELWELVLNHDNENIYLELIWSINNWFFKGKAFIDERKK